jgi:succinylarginine dihydrolase
MHNGGGPACLRLRATFTPAELRLIAPGVLFNAQLYTTLKDWITRRYRDRLTPADLADPQLLVESREALDELTKILGLPPLYRFQLAP